MTDDIAAKNACGTSSFPVQQRSDPTLSERYRLTMAAVSGSAGSSPNASRQICGSVYSLVTFATAVGPLMP